MAYEIVYKPIAYNNPGTPITPIGGVAHDTENYGGNDTVESEWDYFNGGYRSASAHAFVDWISITQFIDWYRKAWHAGPTANADRIGVELCFTKVVSQFNEIWKRGTWLWAYLFYNVLKLDVVDENTLMSHKQVSDTYHETDHQDPIAYFAYFGKTMADFRYDIQTQLNTMKGGDSTVLKLGSIGDAVKTLQQKLIKLGFVCTADGVFGGNTQSAVIAFQKKYMTQADVDGVVGSTTSAAIDKALNPPAPTPVEPTPTSTVPQWKIDGAQYLKDKGYTGSNHDPLETVDIGTLGTILKNLDNAK